MSDNPTGVCKCHKCPKEFINADFLKKHILKDHDTYKAFSSCSECGELFRTKEELIQHKDICIFATPEDDFSVAPPPPAKKPLLDNPVNTNPREESFNVARFEDKIEEVVLPISIGIKILSNDFPNQLMIVWSDNFDKELFESVNLHPANSILIVKDLHLVNLTAKEKSLLNKSDWFIFHVLDASDEFTRWAAISFGGNIPVALMHGQIKNPVQVEQILCDHAKSRGKSIHHVMNYSEKGIFPLLSQHLEMNITAFK